jgi:quercetin 2,3-dioxygenase
VYSGLFPGPQTAQHDLRTGRLAYAQLARGSISVNGQRLNAGDGVLLRDETTVSISDGTDAEILVFDLPTD